MSTPVLECSGEWESECLCGSHGPCWPRPDTSCCPALEPAEPSPEQLLTIERTLHVATEIIHNLSGRQFGACPVIVRPCRQPCADRPSYGYWSGMSWIPVLDAGTWFNSRCDYCTSGTACSCSSLCEVVLPGPVAEVIRVKRNGLVLDPDEYRVDNGRRLVRTSVTVSEAGALGCWPTCQELDKADTEVGTFSVEYRLGKPVPQAGLWAAGLLACQIMKACAGDAECVLPARAQRISRQGVSVEMTQILFKPGEFNTGIPEVDMWLQSVNPYKAKMPSRVFSVDRPAPRQTTWPCPL